MSVSEQQNLEKLSVDEYYSYILGFKKIKEAELEAINKSSGKHKPENIKPKSTKKHHG